MVVGRYVDCIRERVEETLGNKVFAALKQTTVFVPGDQFAVTWSVVISYEDIQRLLVGDLTAQWRDTRPEEKAAIKISL